MTFKDTFSYAFITTLLMIFIFIMGYARPELHRQAIYYRTQFNLGDFTTKELARAKTHYKNEFKSRRLQYPRAKEIYCPFENHFDCRRVLGLIAFTPRYFLFHPSFELSELTHVDVAYFFSAQIVIFVFAFVLITMNVGLLLGAVRSNNGLLVISAFGLLLFVLANGRSVPAVTGFALISLAIIKFGEGNSRILRSSTIAIGLVLCAMSTNLFLTSFLFFLLTSFTPLGNAFDLNVPKKYGRERRDFRSNFTYRVEDILLSIIGMLYSIILIYRLIAYYGPTKILSGLLSHGAGTVLLGQPIQLTLGVITFLIFGIIFFTRFLMSRNPQWSIDQRLRIIIMLACFPAIGILFGFVAVSLCFFGLALLAAYFVEMLTSRTQFVRVFKKGKL